MASLRACWALSLAVAASAAVASRERIDKPTPAPTPPPKPVPHAYHGCLTPPASDHKWCDFSLSHNERIDVLMSSLTLEEKIALISPNRTLSSNMCNDHTSGAPRLGLPPYMWLVETNTGANSACLPSGRCATTFPGPLGLGASFNRTLWRLKGDVLGTELRAFNNIGWHRNAGGTFGQEIGVTGYGPNLNNPRDPRFGRLSELPSEDPYHAGHYAVEMLAGAQQEDVNGHAKMISFLKHFTMYSKETNRGHDTYAVSTFDMFDSYLRQYEIAFTEGSAMGVMCSYDAENGHPSCANHWLLNEVLRNRWNRPDAFVSTDCGAVSNLLGPPVKAPNAAAAAAYAINNGTDLEMGTDLVFRNISHAIAMGLTNESVITAAARRTLVPRFKAGLYDRLEEIAWSKFGEDDVGSPYHTRIRDEAALQSFVLLKNTGVLPLKAGSRIAVIGPQANGFGLFSDYFGDSICPGQLPKGGGKDFSCVTTIAEAIRAENARGATANASGCAVSGGTAEGFAEAIAAAEAADVVVLALGIDNTVEHEGVDRTSIALPELQEALANDVLALGKKTVLVLTNGGPLAIDGLKGRVDAIVEAFNPAFGAPMLARTLFGTENRWGKLPYTIYGQNYINEVNFSSYDMSKPPGRTYRYYTGTPLFRYGEGLSYTTFDLRCQLEEGSGGGGATTPVNFSCAVRNTGGREGDEVVTVYHAAGPAIRATARHPVPLKSLVDFERVSVGAGVEARVAFSLPRDAFALTNADGDRVVYPGQRTVVFSRGTGVDVEIAVTL